MISYQTWQHVVTSTLTNDMVIVTWTLWKLETTILFLKFDKIFYLESLKQIPSGCIDKQWCSPIHLSKLRYFWLAWPSSHWQMNWHAASSSWPKQPLMHVKTYKQDVKGFYSETVHLKLHVEIAEPRLRLRFCLCSRNCLPFLAVFVGTGTVGSNDSLKSEYQL